MIFWFGSLLLAIISYIVYRWVIVPYLFIRFYKTQNIQIKYSPFYCRDVEDVANVQSKGDFYFTHKQMIKENPSLKVLGYQFGTNTYLLVFDPYLIKDIYYRHDIFQKQEAGRLFKGIIDKGLIFLNQDDWKAHRKLVSSIFHYEFLKENVQTIVSIIENKLESLNNQEDNQIDFLELGQNATADIIGELFFGKLFAEYKLEGKSLISFIFDILDQIGETKLDPLVNILGRNLIDIGIFKKHRKLKSDIDKYNSYVKTIVAKKIEEFQMESKERKFNLIDLFCQHALNSKEYCPDEVIPEFNTFLFAGVDTTAHLLLMMSFYLLKHSAITERIKKELEKIIPMDKNKITLEHLNQLDTLQAFIKETLRVASPIPQTFEKCTMKDFQIGELKVKKGTIILQTPLATNYNPNYYDNPEIFSLDRWLDPTSKTNKAIKENPALFIPFGSGPRHCIGQHLAIIIAKIFMILFIQKYEYHISDPNYQLKMTLRVNYEPEEKIRYRLKPKLQ